MTWEKGTREFTCPNCGAIHSASYVNLPVRERGEFNCLKCGALRIHHWNGGVDYDNWKLVDKT